jgi:Alkyl sulfatase C-terminal
MQADAGGDVAPQHGGERERSGWAVSAKSPGAVLRNEGIAHRARQHHPSDHGGAGALSLDSRKAEGMRFTMNLITPDNEEKFIVELENATLTNIKGFLAEKPDLTLTINRSDLEHTMIRAKSLEAQIADGTAKIQGDASGSQRTCDVRWINVRF